MSEYRRVYYQRNRDTIIANQKRYYLAHRDEILERRKGLLSQNKRFDPSEAPITKVGLPDHRWGRKWGVRRPELKKEWGRRYEQLPEVKARDKTRRDALGTRPRPGWTREMRASILLEQKGLCAICGRMFDATWPPHQDHDYKTGKARGLLCVGCNHLLGKAGDSVEVLKRAIAYLKKHSN